MSVQEITDFVVSKASLGFHYIQRPREGLIGFNHSYRDGYFKCISADIAAFEAAVDAGVVVGSQKIKFEAAIDDAGVVVGSQDIRSLCRVLDLYCSAFDLEQERVEALKLMIVHATTLERFSYFFDRVTNITHECHRQF